MRKNPEHLYRDLGLTQWNDQESQDRYQAAKTNADSAVIDRLKGWTWDRKWDQLRHLRNGPEDATDIYYNSLIK